MLLVRRRVFLHGHETWPIRVKGARRPSAFNHLCLRSIARVWSERQVSNVGVHCRVLGAGSRIQWPGHALCIIAHPLPFRELFARAEEG